MNKKVLLISFGLIFWASIFMAGACEASPEFSGYITADDEVWIWGYDGSGNWGGTSWFKKSSESWRTADLIFGFPDTGKTMELYFAVKNIQEIIPDTDHQYGPGEYNPAGLLVDITASSGIFKETGTNKLLTDTTHWEIMAHQGWEGDPVFNPTALSGWVYPTAYGANNSPTLWNQCMGDNPVPNIDYNAQWIWTDNNFNPNMDNYAVLHTRITSTPEPASIFLFGIGGITMSLIKKIRKYFRGRSL